MFGEVLVSNPSDTLSARLAVGTMVGDSNVFRRAKPSECLEAVDQASNTFSAAGSAGKGRRFLDARTVYSMFNTILPPNSPSCRWDGNDRMALVSLSSNHTGGANVCAADGSVHFISNSIGTGTITESLGFGYPAFNPNEPQRWTGRSTYGILGALGSSCASDSGSF
jgi:prepilin-type processing-associated H-X9-DG protein